MATCNKSVRSAPEPDYKNYDGDADRAAIENGRKNLAKQLRAKNGGELVGEIISFPYADGCAQYIVEREKPLRLIHLADHDAWDIPASHRRGR